jgi:hypothetical protein
MKLIVGIGAGLVVGYWIFGWPQTRATYRIPMDQFDRIQLPRIGDYPILPWGV